MKVFVKWMSGASILMLLIVSPLQIKEGKPSYPQAHALIGKLIMKGIKFETKLMLKNWLKGVAKKEGKRVALAAVKSLKALPNDKNFRLALVATLAGGNYAQAAAFTKQRSVGLMKAGARDQWEADKKNLSEHPEIAFQSFDQSVGDTVEGQWNNIDDKYTCGENNVDVELQAVNPNAPNGQQQYVVAKTPNEKLLTGRALLQRTLFLSLMRNSSFQNQQQARDSAGWYSRLACFGGKSRKVTAFIGGIALKGKDKMTKLENVRGKTTQFMNRIDQWAKSKL